MVHHYIQKYYQQTQANLVHTFIASLAKTHLPYSKKAVPLQAWSGPKCSRKLRFPDFMTTAQVGGKVFTLQYSMYLTRLSN